MNEQKQPEGKPLTAEETLSKFYNEPYNAPGWMLEAMNAYARGMRVRLY